MKLFLAVMWIGATCPLIAAANDPLPERWVVTANVADVRSEPTPRSKTNEFDPKQETQVLRGEPVLVMEKKGKWFRVECPLQSEYSHEKKWQGYPGWIEKKNLSKDINLEEPVRMPKEYDDDLRWQIVNEARRHLGNPYLWGGRSLYDKSNKKTLTGVDCSGLVSWAFRQVGWLIPRDAHEQSMKTVRVEPKFLKPGDLFFLAKADNPDKIVHVGIYAGKGNLIESPQTGEFVREVSFQERFGHPLEEMFSGMAVNDRIITFGTFFPLDE